MIRIAFIHIFFLCCWFPYSTSVTLSPCAKWNQTGVYIIGNGQAGNQSNQLNYPLGIFIDKITNTLYVTDSLNDRIQMISLNRSSSAMAISVVPNVSIPAKIYVDDDNNQTIIYIASGGSSRIEKWIQGAALGVQIGDQCIACSGVYLDSDKNVYMSSGVPNTAIVKWSPKTNTSTNATGPVDSINDIYIDQSTNALYTVDDMYIRMWSTNSTTGVQVAGGSNSSGNGVTLRGPFGVWVDENTKIIYTTDRSSRTVQRWQGSYGEIIAGGGVNGTNSSFDPIDLAFDNDGNLYVCDVGSHAVKFFALISNQTCSSTTITSSSTTSTTTTTTTTSTPKNSAVSLDFNQYFKMIILSSIFSIIYKN